MNIIKVGAFGRFWGDTDQSVIDLWKLVEAAYLEENIAWIGIYSSHDLFQWAKNSGKFTHNEINEIINVLV